MRRKKRTEITVETDEILIVRRTGGATRGWCPQCRGEVSLISPEEAATLAGVSSRTIFRWIETGRIHYQETSQGLVWVCLNSLSQHKLT